MKLKELVRIFRENVDDKVEPYNWSPESVMEYANDAELEAARRSRLLIDSSTTAICSMSLTVANNGLVALDPRVIFVRRVRIPTYLPLIRMNMQDMEAMDPYWQDARSNRPTHFITDFKTGYLQFWPFPNATFTAGLTVVRDPAAEMNDPEDSPEILPRYHRSLVFWMEHRAYSVQDSELNDPERAAKALALFEQEFGKKSSAIDETWIEREQMEGDGTY